MRGPRWAAVLGALVIGVATIPIAWGSGPRTISHAAESPVAMFLDLAAGFGLLVAGALTTVNRRHSTGLLALAASVCWFARTWTAWADGPLVVRSVAMVLAPFLLPLLLQLALAPHSGRRSGLALRILIASSYVGTAVVTVVWGLFRDPLRARQCWGNCSGNSFLLRWESGLTGLTTAGWRWFTISVAVALASATLWRIATATPPARRGVLLVSVPTTLAVLAQAAYAAALLADPEETTSKPLFIALFAVQSLTLVTAAGAILVSAARDLRRRTDVARLADLLGAAPVPGRLRATLARALGDDRLDVGYWVPDRSAYIDASGRQFDLEPDSVRAVTQIVRNGEPVAVVVHDAALAGSHDLAAEVGAAARLAVDNERLLAQQMMQLAELRASRRRIVEAADAERRRLERNLHDGAQQRLLSLAYTLQLGAAVAREEGDAGLLRAFRSAVAEAEQALTEVRELAHGIFPVILAEAGLGPALETFADTAPLGVELGDVPSSRFDPEVEAAVYSAVTGACSSAAHHNADQVRVSWRVSDRVLDVDVDAGVDIPATRLVTAADRIGAVGGTLAVRRSHVEVRVPCGS